MSTQTEGLLLLDKPTGRTSFWLVRQVRFRLGVRKVGHAGTLDPFATGVMVLLVGRQYTRLSARFLRQDKEYLCRLRLGQTSTTGDPEGKIQEISGQRPSKEAISAALQQFQGTILQTPPMYSAKKVGGKKLYELARKGLMVERQPVAITLETELRAYCYPYLDLRVLCSKGAYMRTLACDIGTALGCGAYLQELCRTRSGPFLLSECIDEGVFMNRDEDLKSHLRTAECEPLASPKSV